MLPWWNRLQSGALEARAAVGWGTRNTSGLCEGVRNMGKGELGSSLKEDKSILLNFPYSCSFIHLFSASSGCAETLPTHSWCKYTTVTGKCLLNHGKLVLLTLLVVLDCLLSCVWFYSFSAEGIRLFPLRVNTAFASYYMWIPGFSAFNRFCINLSAGSRAKDLLLDQPVNIEMSKETLNVL